MRDLYFFIGTEAEIMKMFIVINKAKKEGFSCHVISSGQNDISNSPFMKLCDSRIDVDLSIYKPKEKNGKAYLKWFVKTLRYGKRIMKRICAGYEKENAPIMIIHGDTLSTLLGALIATGARMRYCHVEGGLRSYNWLNPFPEEIDRYFGSRKAEIIFCPGEKAAETAKKCFKGKAVNTVVNTNYEVLQYAINKNVESEYPRYCDEKYFVAAIHRQENLINGEFMKKALDSILELSRSMKCVFIYHKQTENSLKRNGLWDSIKNDENVVFIERLDYFQFIEVVQKSEFLLADGAGNQQEMFYLGKPYLILRDFVEKDSEGLGMNAINYHGDFDLVRNFDKHYMKYRHEPVSIDESPSDIIVDALKAM